MTGNDPVTVELAGPCSASEDMQVWQGGLPMCRVVAGDGKDTVVGDPDLNCQTEWFLQWILTDLSTVD